MTDEPSWLDRDDVLLIHRQQIELYGGVHGLRDSGALESTLARPRNLNSYRTPDIFELAASYAFGFARNHCFIDGNKRVAFAASALFLLDNGFLVIPHWRHTPNFEGLAAGTVDEPFIAQWLREMSVSFPNS